MFKGNEMNKIERSILAVFLAISVFFFILYDKPDPRKIDMAIRTVSMFNIVILSICCVRGDKNV